MVSTRGVKVKFVDGERVLCYEPDPTKAKVLYDSKVLEVKVTKDSRGRKIIEYLIHFQGWNSSWDRCVSEDYVLKDTTENRQLQRDLAAKAQLQLGAYLYRRDKKRPRKSSDQQDCVSDESASPGVETDTQSESTESEMSADDDGLLEAGENETITPVIELTDNLRALAEFDYEMIKHKNKLIRIPAEPNVVHILESFMRRFATNQCDGAGSEVKHKTRQRINSHSNKLSNVNLIYQHLNVCREYLDGLRIYFDHTLCDLLLYNPEKPQALAATSKPPTLTINNSEPNIKVEPSDNVDIKQEENHDEIPKLSEMYFYDESINNNKRFGIGRRCLRSNRVSQHSESQDGSIADTNGFTNFDSLKRSNRSSIASTESDASGPLSQVINWKLLPESGNKHLPSFNYGAAHLLRLIIKLPELLMAANIPETKMKTVLRLTDNLVDFLDEHPEWFADRHYIDNKNLLNNN